MNSLRLINYRNFEDTGDIPIRPLTFLLGANSSGKSSFLKIFPLIKQSANSQVRGTFLWNGNLVDMEDFNNVVHNGKGNITMKFSLSNIPFSSYYIWEDDAIIESCDVTLVLAKENGPWDFLKSITIENKHFSIDVNFLNSSKVESIWVNKENLSSIMKDVQMSINRNFIPRIFFECDGRIDDGSETARNFISEILSRHKLENPLNLHRFFMDLPFEVVSGRDVEKLIYKRLSVNLSMPSNDISDIINYGLYNGINQILDSIRNYFVNFASCITYVAPLRANFERYYRFQNYSVDNIDADGHNLAMFLNSLNSSEIEDFNEWLAKVFNFEVHLSPSVGHVAIELKEKDKPKRNLVDIGFGYTEMLPILAMIWKVVKFDRKKRIRGVNKGNSEHYFAIEQPELHLHPRFQAKFAELLVNVINNAIKHNFDIHFVIETHSEVIINKIGQLIDNGKFNHTNVNVVLFNAKHEGLDNYVETIQYSEDGYIINWPYGFFEEDAD